MPYTHRKGTSARLGVLCPEQEEGEEGEGGTVLSYIELPFAEEVETSLSHCTSHLTTYT